MKPLIFITNDDGHSSRGLACLTELALEVADVVVVTPELNSSGKSHSLTSNVPLRVRAISEGDHLSQYACTGTPVDCVKLGEEHLCPRKPDLILSGINHGSNASINVIYSGTMGAVIEASTLGYPAVGFSLLSHSAKADFSHCLDYVRAIIKDVLENGLPSRISLNVNIPKAESEPLKGIRVCREAGAYWSDSFEKRIDPSGQPYYWLTGKFVCLDNAEDTDEYALHNGYISIVPTHPDYTAPSYIEPMRGRFEKIGK
ncbi:MAG: 5'/3'-nucleotidase SurE [Bacteroidales bacterium]|nr:5'/3'-nucleotidase SurE [Bacteroidales bacterium]